VLVRHDEESYAFRHALLQETLESDLLPGERAGFHLALARALEDDPTLVSRDGRAAAELCGHWLGAHRLPEALAAAVRAGAEAEQVYAFAEASRHFQRALELWDRVDDADQPTGIDQSAVYARAADCALLSGDGPEAIRLIEAAIERLDARADPYRAALLREGLARYLFMGAGDTEGAQRALQEAIDLLPAGEPRQGLARVLAYSGAMLMLRGRTLESVDRCEQAIGVARQVGDRAAEVHALGTQGMNLASLGDRSAGIASLRESLRMSDELGDAYGLFRSYLNLSDALDMDGRVEQSADVALEGAARAREWRMAARALVLEAVAATRLFKLGRMDEADRLTELALELRPSLAKLRQCAASVQLEVHRGRAAEAELLIRAAEDATPSVSWANWMEPLASSRVELELLRGRPEEARRLGEEALQPAADHEQVFFTARLHAVTARADALIAERARAGGDEGAPIGSRACSSRRRGAAPRLPRRSPTGSSALPRRCARPGPPARGTGPRSASDGHGSACRSRRSTPVCARRSAWCSRASESSLRMA
jgi:tetratricopeptide (TPR) repeat protein